MIIWIVVVTFILIASMVIATNYIGDLLDDVADLKQSIEYETKRRQEVESEFDCFVGYLGHVRDLFPCTPVYTFRKRTKREK